MAKNRSRVPREWFGDSLKVGESGSDRRRHHDSSDPVSDRHDARSDRRSSSDLGLSRTRDEARGPLPPYPVS